MTFPLRHLRLAVTYDGSSYFGFQIQVRENTVQAELERACGLVLKETVRVIGSGRTDTGVHAVGQVVLVRTKCPIPVEKFILAVNGVLPESIRVRTVEEVDGSFHPRFRAKGKQYRYLFRLIDEPSPFLARYFCQVAGELDVERMRLGAQAFVGEHDFAAFTRSPDRHENTVRTIRETALEQEKEVITFDVTGNGFLHNMVRNMARALLLIGQNRMDPSELGELYRNQDRRRLGSPAPAGGLYLMRVMY